MAEIRIEWVEIVEPRTREHMYANLTTGECAWDPPPGVPVKRTNDNQWWELFDSNTGRFYYYNATTMNTVWHRPHGCDIIPLAKLQTLKQNTEMPNQEYDVPELPSNDTPASYSAAAKSPPKTTSSSQTTVSCQTQTTPTATPKMSRSKKHYQQREKLFDEKDSVEPTKQNFSVQTDGQSSVRSSCRHRQCSKGHLHHLHQHQHRTPQHNQKPQQDGPQRHRSIDLPDPAVYPRKESFDHELQSLPDQSMDDMYETEKMVKDFENFAVNNRGADVLKCTNRKFPLCNNEVKIVDGKNEGKAFQFERSYMMNADNNNKKRPVLDPCGSPILGSMRGSPHNWTPKHSSHTLGKPTRAKTAPRDVIRDVFAQNFSAQAKIVLTKNASTSSAARKTSVESLTATAQMDPLTNRVLDRVGGAEVKEAHIVSTRNGQQKQEQLPSAMDRQQQQPSPPVWTQRSDFAMIKSLDSGIRSADSTGERAADQQMHLPAPQTTVNIRVSPKPCRSNSKALSSSRQRHKTPPPASREPLSLAPQQPYEHLSFNQEHQQFVLARSKNDTLQVASNNDNNNNNDDISRNDYDSSDDENVLGMNDDEVFADDEVDLGDETPQSMATSVEELNNREVAPFGHYHAPALGTRSPALRLATNASSGRTNASIPSVKMPVLQLSGGAVSVQKRNSDMDAHQSGPLVTANYPADNNAGRRSSLERQQQCYPGDISPPLNRPQSMMVSQASAENQLPPNTATLCRPPKSQTQQQATAVCTSGVDLKTDKIAVSVSRSASSLTKGSGGSCASQPMSLALYRPDSEMDNFAQENINRHKKGLFGKRHSMQTMLSWSREAIKMPLIMTDDRHVKKEACNVFKRIQAYMGDRKVKASVSIEQLALDLCIRGWLKPPLRDEIIMQIVKQITDNPKTDSLRRGWELMAICLTFFPTSEAFQSFLDNFVQRNCDPLLDIPEVPISHYAQHCARKLDRVSVSINGMLKNCSNSGRKGMRKPTLEEVQEARVQIFNPSMFGASLDEVMAIQNDRFSDHKLPWIQTTLSEMVLQLKGPRTEGIFRVPGDVDEVQAGKMRMDRWLVPAVRDPHVPASLLKLWYRQLAEPLVPHRVYDRCLAVSDDPVEACRLVEKMPTLNRLVLAYLIRFLQVFIRPEHISETKMDASNLAMVMAPNVLRCASDDPRVIFENTRREMTFLRTLMQHYDTSFMQGLI